MENKVGGCSTAVAAVSIMIIRMLDSEPSEIALLMPHQQMQNLNSIPSFH